MIEPAVALEINRRGWNTVAPRFRGGTALPEYGPLAATEEELGLLTGASISRVLELGCGSGHSLYYLGQRGAGELWGIDLSSVQIAFAQDTLRPFASKVRLIESPMELNPGVPGDYFDLVFSIYGIGWTTNLPATMALVSKYLRPGGLLIVSGEHPVYGCLAWNGTQYVVSMPYLPEGPQEHSSWNGVPIVIQRRTLGSFIEQTVRAGLQLEALVEAPLHTAKASREQDDPARWYSIPRASVMPTTFIIKARKPSA